MRVLVTYPPLRGPGTPTLGQNRQFQWFQRPTFIYPLVPASAATLLHREGFDVLWKDAIAERMSWSEYENYLITRRPDIIAVETKTPVVRRHWRILRRIRYWLPRSKLILMGDHVTALPEESLLNSPVDFVITGGDYDFSLLGLARHLRDGAPLPPGIYYKENGAIENTGSFRLTGDLDGLPFIDRGLTGRHMYGERLYKRLPFTYVAAGRDCAYGRCTFCSWTTLYPKYRARSPENVLAEIGQLAGRYGVREIFDDTGTFPSGEWLREFCRGMIKSRLNNRIRISCNFRSDYLMRDDLRLMRRAGFRLMKIGLESASQDTLDRLKKGTNIARFEESLKRAKAAGLEIHLTIMIGFPWETRADAERTVALGRGLLRKGVADMLQATVVVPYPGTPLYKEAIENDWFRVAADDYDKFDMTTTMLKTPGMSPEEVMALCAKCYGGFLTPGYIWSRLRDVRSLEDVRFLARGIGPVLGHIGDFAFRPRKGKR
jgi:radical SAM superfamily enzyme YgiQ (UPF0313 family)